MGFNFNKKNVSLWKYYDCPSENKKGGNPSEFDNNIIIPSARKPRSRHQLWHAIFTQRIQTP